MIHYTPLFNEEVFPSEDNLVLQSMSINGIWLEGYSSNNGDFIIQKLISTNPNDYLNETYQPGRNFSI